MTILKNVVQFTGLVVGVPTSLPHKLNVNGIAVIPDLVLPKSGGATVTADKYNVTVTRTATGAASLDVYVEHWHTIEDAEPPGGLGSLVPFVAQGGGTGAQVAIAAGTQTALSGTVFFSDNAQVTFGMSNSSVVTASIVAIKSFSAGGNTATGPGISFLNANNVTFGLNGNTITGSVQTAGGTATGVGISAGTQVATTGAVIFSNSNGITFGLNNQTLTASYSTAVFSNSNGISFGTNGSTVTASVNVSAGAIVGLSAVGGAITSGTAVFSNSNSVSFGINGQTITVSAYQPSILKTVGFTATGGETDFNVTFAALPSANYEVFPALRGVSLIFGVDLPAGTDRVNSAFRVVPTGSLSSGDQMAFLIFAS